MRRLPFLLSAAALLHTGCDFFTTREFRPKPSEIRVLPGLSRSGDSVTFLATEALWSAGAATPEQTLSRRRVTFAFGKDSAADGDELKVLTMRIRDDSSGRLVEEARRVVRFSPEGVALPGVAGGGARYYPLKAAAAADTDAFLALPTLLIEGWDEAVAMGVFTVERVQSAVDTLAFPDRQEEAWVISESVLDGGRAVSAGKYWYGASGLLKAEQVWDGFDWRRDNGAPGTGISGGTGGFSLRRSVVRL